MLLWFGTGLLFWPPLGLFYRLMGKLAWQQSKHKNQVLSLEVKEDGLTVGTELAQSRLQWKALISYRESAHLFLAYYTARTFYTIPKRAFPSEAAIQQFRQLLKKQIDQA
ncbi:MAG: YcxB family protein [Leptolyngbya sp. SIO4C1]|nr:YcxB family protein [Leptolyngbya sp. SIO4C1]